MWTPHPGNGPPDRPHRTARHRVPNSRRHRTSRPALFGTVIVFAWMLAACSSTSTSAPTSTAIKPGTTSTTTTASGGPLRFSPAHAVAHGVGLSAISCGSPAMCVAFDTAGRAYAFNGTSWSGPVPSSPQTLGTGAISVSCGGPTFCMAVATAADQVVSFNGQAWSAPTTLDGADNLDSVGCAPTSYCAAIDSEGNAFSFSGQWQGTSGAWGSASSIACVSSSFCMAASGGIAQWNGEQWTQPAPFGATSSFNGVSCASTTFCVSVDQTGDALQWNGQAWSAPAPIEPASTASGGSAKPAPTAISCPSAASCTAVDSAGGVLQFHGGTWTRTVVDGAHHLKSVSCPTPAFCAAVDDAGQVVLGTRAKT